MTGNSALRDMTPAGIITLRRRLGLSQRRLAALLGVSELTVRRWEHGHSRPSERTWQHLHQVEQRNTTVMPPSNLVAERTRLIGREQELSIVADALAAARLVTLTGAGGIGKTRLAQTMAAAVATRFSGGVRFVDLAPLSEPDFVVRTVATALGIRERAGQPLLKTLTAALATRSVLIVLDNCEHLIDASATLANHLLDGCPRVRLLATSREPLGVAGERIVPVPPLPVDAAVELFTERARERNPAFALSETTAAVIARICRRLDGLPLAIELATARVRLLSLAQIEAHLDDRLRLLSGGTRATSPRHQSLAAALAWSVDLLSEAERRLFLRLSVFASNFSLEAARWLNSDTPQGETGDDDVLDLLGRLVEKSLVTAESHGDAMQYYLLETLRAYGRERLASSGDLAGALRRHAAFCLRLVETATLLPGLDQTAIFARLDEQSDDIRAALAWSTSTAEEAETALRLALAMGPYWLTRGHISEGRTWVERALAAEAGGRPRPALRAPLLRLAANLARRQTDFATARRAIEEALAIERERDDKRGIARTLSELSALLFEEGDFASCRAIEAETLPMLRDLGDEEGLIQQLTAVGLRALAEQDAQTAITALDEVVALARRSHRRDALGQALLNRGVAEMEAGRMEEAGHWLKESITVARGVGDRLGTAYALSNIGLVHYGLGHLADARDHLLAALDLAVALELPWGMASLLDGLGIVAAAAGNNERAARLFGSADTLLDMLDKPPLRFLREERPAIRAAVREALGSTAYLTAYARGAAMTQEEAIAEARCTAAAAPEPQTESTRTDRPTLPQLTRREAEVLDWLTRGRSTKEIARALVLSPRTVERHLANIYMKLDVGSRSETIALVLRAGVLPERPS